jgi:hypothetical protein
MAASHKNGRAAQGRGREGLLFLKKKKQKDFYSSARV